MIPSQDPFWNVPAREKAEEDAIRIQIDNCERAINLGRRVQQIRNQPGYQELVKAVEDMKTGVGRRLMLDKVDDASLRELRGRAQGLNDVLAILTRTDHALDLLEANLQTFQIELAEAQKRRPQPVGTRS